MKTRELEMIPISTQINDLLQNLPDLRQLLRGSLVTRYRRCGKANCHCANKDDPGHGPSYYLVVTVAPRKTVQVYVSKEQKEKVEQSIQNFNRVREILEEVSNINRAILKRGEFSDARNGKQ